MADSAIIHNKNSAFGAPVVIARVEDTLVCGRAFCLVLHLGHGLSSGGGGKEEGNEARVEAKIYRQVGFKLRGT